MTSIVKKLSKSKILIVILKIKWSIHALIMIIVHSREYHKLCSIFDIAPPHSSFTNAYIMLLTRGGAVVAQWIRPRTLNREAPGSNLLAAAVLVPSGKALYPYCLVPRKGHKDGGPWLLAYKQLALSVAR